MAERKTLGRRARLPGGVQLPKRLTRGDAAVRKRRNGPRGVRGPARLTHVDASGRARMVDVGSKRVTARKAVASARLVLAPSTLALLSRGGLPKGDAVGTARLAGIQAAKRTADLIPLCHPLQPAHIDVAMTIESGGVRIEASVAGHDRTGYEMEALVAASVAALTLYDMVKAVEREAVIEWVRLEAKSGGKSGRYVRGLTRNGPLPPAKARRAGPPRRHATARRKAPSSRRAKTKT